MTTSIKAKLTWDTLVQLEPRLGTLLIEMRKVTSKGNPRFCANAVWYGYDDQRNGFRERMSRLVGTDAKPHPILGTSEAYDIAYDVLCDTLPDCRHNGTC